MKRLHTLALLAFIGLALTGCKQTDAAAAQAGTEVASNTANLPAKMETASFNIDGMTCSMGCAKTIESKLSKMDGVQKATVDFDSKTATVEFDANKQTPETLVKTVESAADGKTYKVHDVKSSGNKAMVYQDQEKEKAKKKAGKTGPGADEKSAKSCASDAKDGKPGCCAAKKKHCADEQKA